MNQYTRQEIKERIGDIAIINNGLSKLSGVDVKVRNLKVYKTEAVVDIVLYIDEVQERYNGQRYLLKELFKEK